MEKSRDYYVSEVPPELVKNIEILKKARFKISTIFIHALRYWFAKGLDACAVELMEEKMAEMGFKKEIEVKEE